MNEKNKNQLTSYDRYLHRKRIALAVLVVMTVLVAMLYMCIGTLQISVKDIFQVLAGGGEKAHRTAILNIRLPRVLAAVLVGGILAVAGAVMQCVLRNPLASASTLGVSQGAAFGAALGIIAFGGGAITSSSATSMVSVSNPYVVTFCAFLFGTVSSIVVLMISQFKRDMGPGGLILAGTALSAMFSGGSTLLQYFADDSALGAVVFWTFGNLGSANWKDLAFLFVIFVGAMVYFMANRWNYNAMEAGADTAKSLGVNARGLMLVSMMICSLASAVAVSFVGIISFVGLIAPHIVRVFVGNDHRYLIPGSALAGALLLLLADMVAKVVMPPVILPIGAIMSFVGGPMFLVLLFKGRNTRG